MPATNIIIAVALIVCMTLRLKLVGLLGSFFLKKYISKFSKKKKASRNRKAFKIFVWLKLFLFELNATVQYTSFFS